MASPLARIPHRLRADVARTLMSAASRLFSTLFRAGAEVLRCAPTLATDDLEDPKGHRILSVYTDRGFYGATTCSPLANTTKADMRGAA